MPLSLCSGKAKIDAWMAYGEADLYRESEPGEAEASAEETPYDCAVDDGD